MTREAEPLQNSSSGIHQFEIDDVNKTRRELRCGIGPFSPSWIQPLATKQSFMIVFSILSIIQGMSWSYFVATITTLEKRFKISSQTAGIVMTGNELSQIVFAIVIAHYGSRGHRPRWISIGILFTALSCILLASPHLFYGPGLDALSLTQEYSTNHNQHNTTTNHNNVIKTIDKSKSNRVQLCDQQQSKETTKINQSCEPGEMSIVPLILIFISQFVAGIGVLLFFSLGGPYLDDNIEKTQSPMLFGITMSLRLIGPVLGFLFASLCLKIFISPSLTPIISTDDPRWMGAWWLGWIILGLLMSFTAVFIAMFPRELPESLDRRRQRIIDAQPRRGSGVLGIPETPADLAIAVGSQILYSPHQDGTVPSRELQSLAEMRISLLSLLRNKVNIFNALAGVFYLFSAIGYWTYMPKYMETIFMQTSVSASAYSGTVGIAFQAAGLLISGTLISKYQPSARKLAAWNVLIGVSYVLVKFGFTQMGCHPGNFQEVQMSTTGTSSWNLTTTCNIPCKCEVNKILPVCYKEKNQVFYSACHAGCQKFENNIGSFCSCLENDQATVTPGTCAEGCTQIFIIFLVVSSVLKFLDSTGKIGNMLVSYRCVEPKQKSLAIGLAIFLISIFAMLPAPIFFGYIFDRSCLVWASKCGTRGNCWLYDGESLRYAFNLSAAGFTFIGVIFDALVWYYVNDLDLYDEEKNVEQRRRRAVHS